ncbi:MAG: phosphatase PAP2 family protein [Acidimicrobiales bacterium]
MKRPPWWVEFPVLFVLYQLFEAARGHIHPHAAPALRNARWLEDVERWTWTLREPRLNLFVFDHKTLAQAMNIYYGTIHFVVPPIVLIWLWRRRPHQYRRARNALAAVTISSLAFFVAVPLAPPRFVPAQAHATFHDTTPYGGLGPLDRGNFKDDNPYAAMPSLHVAWSTWCACVLIGVIAPRRRWRWLALLYPAVTVAVVVGTANHWIGDAVGGWVLLAAAWWLANRWERRRDAAPQRGTQDADGSLRR